ncbi:MAG TPA: magnesium transporter [Xanthomonadales bacterium]|nr:magnesium transporter [Xanthomonadales bacterium]
MQVKEQHPWEILREYLAQEDSQGLNDYLSALTGEQSLRAVMRLEPQEQQQLMARVSPESAAEFIEYIPNEPAAELLGELSPQVAASIVSEMDSDDQADVLAELEEEDLEEILRYMDEREAGEARQLLAYDEDVAGGLMMTEYFSYPKAFRSGAVLQDLARREEEYELNNVHYIYVTGRGRKLLGVARIRDIVFASPDTRLSEIVRPAVTVRDSTTLDDLENLFDESTFTAVPVVDGDNRMLGVVRRRAVYDAVAERADAEHMKSQGIVGGEELRSMPTHVRSRRRLSWLSINIVLNLIAASVIAQYQDVLSAVIVLAVFLPIISDMSGCSGNQAVAVSMRELSLGVIKPSDFYYVWRKEAVIGLINGTVLGLLIAAVAWVWQGNAWLGLVVGLALSVNTLIAVSIGGTVPVVLKALKVDPAVASGPILTTITDMCGFFLLLGTASLLLPVLTVN